MDRITEIQARLAAINTELETATGDALTALETESRSLLDEMNAIKAEVEARKALRAEIAAGAGKPMDAAPPAVSAEERAAADFANTNRMTIDAEQARALTVAGGTLVQPTKVSGINEPIGAEVSSLLDFVKVVNCTGMGSHRVAYRKTGASAAADQTEGEVAGAQSLATFGYVDIRPQSVAVLDYITKQAKKQTNLQYAAAVRNQAMVALRLRAVEIVSNAIQNSTLLHKVSGSAVDAKTLRTIAFTYGGAKSIVGNAMLLLNKNTLIAFGDVRGTNEKKAIYEITPDASGTSGVIREGGVSARYCIDDNIPDGKIYYGKLQSVELDLFSDFEVKVSEDFAFDKLMDTIRGDVELGSDMTVPNAILEYSIA